MGVSASALLGRALQRAWIDLRTIGFEVDLRAVIKNKWAELLPLRRWARKRLEDDPGGSGIAHLEWAVVEEMATLFGIDHAEFVKYLTWFTPHVGSHHDGAAPVGDV